MNEVLLILRRAFINSYITGCFSIAKGAAYSGLLSLFPVLSSLATILVQANAEQVSQYLADFIFEVVPPGTVELLQQQFRDRGAKPVWLIVVATVLSICA